LEFSGKQKAHEKSKRREVIFFSACGSLYFAVMIIFPDLTPSRRPSSRKSYTQQQPQLAALIALEMLHIAAELQKEAVAWISVK
jgi:hypothetical protein